MPGRRVKKSVNSDEILSGRLLRFADEVWWVPNDEFELLIRIGEISEICYFVRSDSPIGSVVDEAV